MSLYHLIVLLAEGGLYFWFVGLMPKFPLFEAPFAPLSTAGGGKLEWARSPRPTSLPPEGGGLYQLRRKGWSSLPSASCLPRQKPRSKCSIKRLRIFLDLALGKLLICDHYSGKMRSPFGVTITIYGNRF